MSIDVKSIFNSSFNEIDTLCIAIGRPNKEQNQQHIGLLYINEDGKPKFLHLAWHCDLRKDSPNKKYLWLDIPLHPMEKIHLATMCEMIFDSNKNGIPYGICLDGSGFSKEGEFTSEENYAGLTCATFIIQFFHSQGYDIIDLKKWIHKETDRSWQLQIIELLEKYASKEHIEYQRKKIQEGSTRFKSEEIAIAASLLNPPHTPETVQNPSKNLLSLVVEHANKICL